MINGACLRYHLYFWLHICEDFGNVGSRKTEVIEIMSNKEFSMWNKNTWEPWHIFIAIQDGRLTLEQFMEWCKEQHKN